MWLGNDRGSLYALQNTRYNTSDTRFWDWSFDEMAKYDLPAQLNYVLRYANGNAPLRRLIVQALVPFTYIHVVPSLSYIAHSQGTMQVIRFACVRAKGRDLFLTLFIQAFAGIQVHPELVPYINVFIALAPMAYVGNIKRYGTHHDLNFRLIVPQYIVERACRVGNRRAVRTTWVGGIIVCILIAQLQVYRILSVI